MTTALLIHVPEFVVPTHPGLEHDLRNVDAALVYDVSCRLQQGVMALVAEKIQNQTTSRKVYSVATKVTRVITPVDNASQVCELFYGAGVVEVVTRAVVSPEGNAVVDAYWSSVTRGVADTIDLVLLREQEVLLLTVTTLVA